MPIPEHQLVTWSHQGAVHNSKAAYAAINSIVSAHNWPGDLQIDTYLQGSYKNDTNIYGYSDIDIAIQLNSVFYSNLTEEQKMYLGFTDIPPGFYGWNEFRADVLKVLTSYFGESGVQIGNKSIKVTTPYMVADVVVCTQYRQYRTISPYDYIEGMSLFEQRGNRLVVNFPKLHYQAGVAKNGSTHGWYKPMVRVLKNARNYLAGHRLIADDLAASYFIENLLYNVPDVSYGVSFQTSFFNIVYWILQADLPDMLCQNGQLCLFGSLPEQWPAHKAKHLNLALINLWNNWEV